jgi:hypothetical protein
MPPIAPVRPNLGRIAFGFGLALAAGEATLAQPAIANLTASQPAGTRSVAIAYTLSHPQSLPCTVTLQASRDNGATWEAVSCT